MSSITKAEIETYLSKITKRRWEIDNRFWGFLIKRWSQKDSPFAYRTDSSNTLIKSIMTELGWTQLSYSENTPYYEKVVDNKITLLKFDFDIMTWDLCFMYDSKDSFQELKTKTWLITTDR
jgi:hypothetical protein